MAKQMKYLPVTTTICLTKIFISYYCLESWLGPRYMCVASPVTKREKIYLRYIKVITILDILLLNVPNSQPIVCGMVPSDAL